MPKVVEGCNGFIALPFL